MDVFGDLFEALRLKEPTEPSATDTEADAAGPSIPDVALDVGQVDSTGGDLGDRFHVEPHGPAASQSSMDEAYVLGSEIDAEGLMREVLQNTLDAVLDPAQPARLRVQLIDLDPALVRRLVAGRMAHWHASDIPLEEMLAGPVRTLVLEDFNTRGLEGEIETSQTRHSAFVNFWRRFGDSTKKNGEGGSHGIGGRMALAGASYGRLFFGLTERAEDGRVALMGQGHLKSHKLSDDPEAPEYTKYAIFAEEIEVRGHAAICHPFKGAQAREIGRSLGMSRQPGETGFSIALPFVKDRITIAALRTALLRNFYYQIAAGKLIVDFPDETVDASNIRQVIVSSSEASDRLGYLSLALAEQAGDIPTFQANTGKTPLDESAFGAAEAAAMRQIWEEGRPFRAWIPFNYQRSDLPGWQNGWIKVLMRQVEENEAPGAAFFRQGCMLSKYRVPIRQSVVIVEAMPGAASAFFANAEPPAHDAWSRSLLDDKRVFKNIDGRLRTMRHCAPDIEAICAPEDSAGVIRSVFDAVFAAPEMDRVRSSRSQPKAIDAKRDGKRDARTNQNPDHDFGEEEEVEAGGGTPLVRAISMKVLEDGFVLRLRDPSVLLTSAGKLELKVAYATRKGNAFKRHSPLDFSFAPKARRPVSYSVRGAVVEVEAANLLSLELTGAEFTLEARGYDPRRDLEINLIDVEAREAAQSGDA
ncbi:hypothetical protein CKO28_06130 [Rhodovibrio sodomensis]|uniref:Uncharacterized protein n=1 Tax=Rhodovibrio sodomensis TaxID=1088 RepID=A0ABS1DDX5_9PROT|nr:hypothetical protein [Rhodovibrio sodomensis]MBK1667610.1 hypothetical protein [Rhodovibrio sodomensis]